jgi:hypothetical protein
MVALGRGFRGSPGSAPTTTTREGFDEFTFPLGHDEGEQLSGEWPL